MLVGCLRVQGRWQWAAHAYGVQAVLIFSWALAASYLCMASSANSKAVFIVALAPTIVCTSVLATIVTAHLTKVMPPPATRQLQWPLIGGRLLYRYTLQVSNFDCLNSLLNLTQCVMPADCS